MSRCSIRITHLKKQSEPDIKGITFEITDNEVLSLTNGIVQGMSGSPIIQNNKLIGCVTHVDMNNVHQVMAYILIGCSKTTNRKRILLDSLFLISTQLDFLINFLSKKTVRNLTNRCKFIFSNLFFVERLGISF